MKSPQEDQLGEQELSLELAMQLCAGKLPEGYIIELNIENGAAWLQMFCDGEPIWDDNDFDDDKSLTQRYLFALDYSWKDAIKRDAIDRQLN